MLAACRHPGFYVIFDCHIMDKHDAPFLIFVSIILTIASSVMIASEGFDGLDRAADDKKYDFYDIVDAHGRIHAVSETAASWEECMDMAQERINYGTDQTYIIAQMEWDITVCDRLFPASEAAGTDLAVPGVVP